MIYMLLPWLGLVTGAIVFGVMSHRADPTIFLDLGIPLAILVISLPMLIGPVLALLLLAIF